MLQKNNSRKKLALMNIKLGDLGAAYLATVFLYHKDYLQHIKELDLRDNNITNLGAESLKSIPGNMTILVDGNDIDNSIFEKSVEALGENN
ncbi:MAG: hypothetical protein AB8Y67_03905 [Coxiella-like endosymbiont]